MPTTNPIHHAFDIVADDCTRLLILGSLPGAASLAAGRYYAHPRNQFWQLLSPVVGTDLVALDYEARLDALRATGIGLWDVIASGRRDGSLDAAIRDARPRDLKAVIAKLPTLRAVAFNGATAWKLGVRQLGTTFALPMIALPSSSPAHAVGVGAKQAAWMVLRDWLA